MFTIAYTGSDAHTLLLLQRAFPDARLLQVSQEAIHALLVEQRPSALLFDDTSLAGGGLARAASLKSEYPALLVAACWFHGPARSSPNACSPWATPGSTASCCRASMIARSSCALCWPTPAPAPSLA